MLGGMFTGNQGSSASLEIPIPVPAKGGVAGHLGSLMCRPLVVRAQKPASVKSSAKPRGGTSGALPIVLGLRHHSFHSLLVCVGGSLCTFREITWDVHQLLVPTEKQGW